MPGAVQCSAHCADAAVLELEGGPCAPSFPFVAAVYAFGASASPFAALDKSPLSPFTIDSILLRIAAGTPVARGRATPGSLALLDSLVALLASARLIAPPSQPARPDLLQLRPVANESRLVFRQPSFNHLSLYPPPTPTTPASILTGERRPPPCRTLFVGA